jgi:hypothetical protein
MFRGPSVEWIRRPGGRQALAAAYQPRLVRCQVLCERTSADWLCIFAARYARHTLRAARQRFRLTRIV